VAGRPMSTPALPDRLHTEDGVSLAARWDRPSGTASGVVVLCHPHPQRGGHKDLPLLRTVAACLTEAGLAVLRFDFRGVGDSGGSWGGGEAELGDVAAAVLAASRAFPEAAVGLAGWSFGAVAALRWQAAAAAATRYVGIAPPTHPGLIPALPDPALLAPARRLFIVGDRDQFADTGDLAAYAEALGADLRLLPGADHFFLGRERRVGEEAAALLAAP
jgi:alpha/beta superfamily hydrolase